MQKGSNKFTILNKILKLFVLRTEQKIIDEIQNGNNYFKIFLTFCDTYLKYA